MDPERQQSHRIKQRHPHTLFFPKIFRLICIWSRARLLIHEWDRDKILRLTLEELEHKQAPTAIHCNSSTATGTANSTVKWQRPQSMEIRYFWISDQVSAIYFNVRCHPGLDNLGDYLSKNFGGNHHQNTRPYYLHKNNSPVSLDLAPKPSTLWGCVGTNSGAYMHVHLL